MLKKAILPLFFCLFVSLQVSADPLESRLWHTNDGNPPVKAEAMDAKYDQKTKETLIFLKKADGTTLSVPYKSLTPDCREHAWYDVQYRRAKQKNRPFHFSPPGKIDLSKNQLSTAPIKDIPDTFKRSEGEMLLEIAPRIHALGRPPEGWCGEVAIQEALLYYGIFYPQDKINEAGKPAHPDLYANDIPVVLKKLQMDYSAWDNREGDLDDYFSWLRKQIADGVPVLTAVKIYPTQHEEWALDHFVLAVGIKGDSLIQNTTWGFRCTLTEQKLRSTDKGFSFANKYNRYYGISIEGPLHKEDNERPVRLFVRQETADLLAVIVKCENLEPGKKYALYKSGPSNELDTKPLVSFTAERSEHAFNDTISRESPTIYRCLEISE